jgi:hypothetical protein
MADRPETTARSITPGQAYVTPHHLAARARAANAALREELRQLRAPSEDAAPIARPLQRDPLVFLAHRGSLPGESLRAGQEIARVFYAITASLTGRVTAQYGERLPAGTGDDWAPAMRAAYAERYVPWSAEFGRVPLGRSTVRDMTLLVAADGMGCHPAARQIGSDHRTVLRQLQASLWWYAETAGWIDRPCSESEIGA